MDIRRTGFYVEQMRKIMENIIQYIQSGTAMSGQYDASDYFQITFYSFFMCEITKSSTWERAGFTVLTNRRSGFPSRLAITLRYWDWAVKTWDLGFSRFLLRRWISSGVWNHVEWLQSFWEKPTTSVYRDHRVRRYLPPFQGNVLPLLLRYVCITP
jgi:hypothetical protein